MRIRYSFKNHYEDQGCDLYVRKLDKGAGYGSGYMVEIYEYGQKVDEKKVKTKKQIKEIIDAQKSKFNTDRAFDAESHLFISYRIDDIESSKFRKNHDIKVKESTMDIDDKLYKQAAAISYLLSVDKYPDVPLKHYRTAENIFDFNQPTENNAQGALESEEAIVNQISDKLTAYFSSIASYNGQGPKPNPHNDISHSLAEYAKILHQQGYNVESIRSKLKHKYLNSELPGSEILNQALQSDINQSVPIENTEQEIQNTTDSLQPQNEVEKKIASSYPYIKRDNIQDLRNINKHKSYKESNIKVDSQKVNSDIVKDIQEKISYYMSNDQIPEESKQKLVFDYIKDVVKELKSGIGRGAPYDINYIVWSLNMYLDAFNLSHIEDIVKTAGVLPNDLLNTQKNTQMTNTSVQDQMNSNQAVSANNVASQDPSLSIGARNMIDAVSKQPNPLEVPDIIQKQDNWEQVANEIAQSKDETEGAYTIREYLQNKAASVLYDKVNDAFIKFSNFVSKQKSYNSYNSLYAYWLKNNQYERGVKAGLDFKVATFVDSVATIKKGNVYKNYWDTAANKVFASLIAKYGMFKWHINGNNISQLSPALDAYFGNIYNIIYDMNPNVFPKANLEDYKEKMDQYLKSQINDTKLSQGIIQVIMIYYLEGFKSALNDRVFINNVTRKPNSTSSEALQVFEINRELFLEEINIKTASQRLVEAFRQFIILWDTETKQNYDPQNKVKQMEGTVTDIITQFSKVILGESLKTLTEYGVPGYTGFDRIITSIGNNLKNTLSKPSESNSDLGDKGFDDDGNYIPRLGSISFINTRYAVNIIINESPDGSSSVNIEDPLNPSNNIENFEQELPLNENQGNNLSQEADDNFLNADNVALTEENASPENNSGNSNTISGEESRQLEGENNTTLLDNLK